MPSPDSNADAPLRGLDPCAMLGIFGEGKRKRPIIPGWEIESILGEGGLGIVWRARRISDNAVAAVKVPRLSEIEHLERLEHEAATLRALTHPHIVRLLESGPLDDGGMFLAMEYIDGPALSHALPLTGFDPARAYEIFHQIAAATAHAHAQGVIHRDLKPANILLAPDGTARVADFGLARPVHERVQHLSLTHSGVVAGTAEYLPPEAYRAGYVPGVKGDIYALGIVLHELLTGSPPRGAWRAVSQQRRTDIRVDEVLQKALAPDHAQRWSSVTEMSAALAEIHRTPARYSGTPVITPAIRAADAAWTCLGLLILFALFGVVLRLTRSGIPWPIDLIGKHSLRTGGYQAIFFLLIALAPLAIWQILRLRRFRAVPLREALPSPFGLRLSTTRVAAALIFTTQLLCLVIPAFMLAAIFFGPANYWLKPGDPAWRDGLIVTKWGSDQLLDPWSWPEKDTRYWLKEYRGVPGDRLARQIDYLDFYPGVMPWTIAASAATIALTLLVTCATAVFRWWPRRRTRSVALSVASFAAAAWVFWPQPKARLLKEQEQRDNDRARRDDKNLYAVLSERMFQTLYSNPAPTREKIEKAVLPYYASEVGFRDRGRIPKSEVLALLTAESDQARQSGRTVQIFGYECLSGDRPNLKSAAFRNRATLLMFFEPSDQEATAQWITIEHSAIAAPGEGTIYILEETYTRHDLYRATPRDLPPADAATWARDFVTALGTVPIPGTEDPLKHLLTERGYVSNDTGRSSRREYRQFARAEYIALLRSSPLSDSSNTRPSPADSPTPAEPQPGARQRITFPVLDANGRTHWQADLVFQEGRWQAVTVRF